jgi:hypothetical protein
MKSVEPVEKNVTVNGADFAEPGDLARADGVWSVVEQCTASAPGRDLRRVAGGLDLIQPGDLPIELIEAAPIHCGKAAGCGGSIPATHRQPNPLILS